MISAQPPSQNTIDVVKNSKKKRLTDRKFRLDLQSNASSCGKNDKEGYNAATSVKVKLKATKTGLKNEGGKCIKREHDVSTCAEGKVGRKCGLCGEVGHNSRTCKSKYFGKN